MKYQRLGRFFVMMGMVGAIALLYSCGGQPGTAGREGVDPEAAAVSEDQLSGNYPIPPIEELTKRLEKAGVGYVIDAGNDPSRVADYVTSTSRAINLGVYGADLSYASTYGVKSEMLRYLNVVVKLTNDMNIRSQLLEDLKARGEEAAQNKDSMQRAASQSIFEAYAALCSNGQQEEAVLFLAGGWLEAVYLGSYIASLSQSSQEVVELLLQQQKTFNTIKELLAKHKQTEDGMRVEELFLQRISPLYEQLKENPSDAQLLTSLCDNLFAVRQQLVEVDPS